MPGPSEEYAEMLNRRTGWWYGRLGATWGPGVKNGDAWESGRAGSKGMAKNAAQRRECMSA